MKNRKFTKSLAITVSVIVLLLSISYLSSKYISVRITLKNTSIVNDNNTYTVKRVDTLLNENKELTLRLQELKQESKQMSNSQFITEIYEIVYLVDNINNKEDKEIRKINPLNLNP